MKEWHCVLYGQPQGPFAEDRLREMIEKGEVAEDTLVWCGATPEDAARGWVKAGESEIAPIFAEKPAGRGAPGLVDRVGSRQAHGPRRGVFLFGTRRDLSRACGPFRFRKRWYA